MPHLPIPPLLRGAEAGSFAEDTIIRRLPEIAQRVISENTFDTSINRSLQALVQDLPHGLIRPLTDIRAPDWSAWQEALQPFLEKSWLEIPLFAAEMYFYRRILEATGYFQPGPGYGEDPYRQQKKLGLEQGACALAQEFPRGLTGKKDRLLKLIYLSLWANQADLSLWPVQGESGGKAQGEGGKAHMIVDQSASVLELIHKLSSGQVEFLLDNTGTELGFDLLLVDALLEENPGISIRLHVKPYPCFVSDAIEEDVTQALRWLSYAAPAWANPPAKRLEMAKESNRLKIATNFYWASPTPSWEMPPTLRTDLSRSALIISKGDVNYRRWIGDARWPAATPLVEIFDPPAPLLLLRVLKSDVAAGLQPGQAEELSGRDASWQLDGHWGMIQFVKPI